MLKEVMEDDDFLSVSSAMRLVNISGRLRMIDLTFLKGKYIGLHV
jgi:hypothetical protein